MIAKNAVTKRITNRNKEHTAAKCWLMHMELQPAATASKTTDCSGHLCHETATDRTASAQRSHKVTITT